MSKLETAKEIVFSALTDETRNGYVLTNGVNATEIAKLFNKNAMDFMRLDSTIDYIDGIAEMCEIGHSTISIDNNVLTINNSLLLLEFSSWLSIEFNYWVLKTTLSLLEGKTVRL